MKEEYISNTTTNNTATSNTTANGGVYDEESFDWRGLLFKCSLHWPWFVGGLAACLIGAWFYLHFTTPVYNVSASVLIKEDDKKGGSSQGMKGLADLTQIGVFSNSQNFDNEIEVLKSKTLIRGVVDELNLYTSYFDKSSVPTQELYKSTPLSVILPSKNAEILQKGAQFKITLSPDGQVDLEGIVEEVKYQRHFNRLPALLPTAAGTFLFQWTNSRKPISDAQKITVVVNNPNRVTEGYSKALNVSPSSKTTTIALLSINDNKKQRAADFINRLVEDYNRSANDDKNMVAIKTAAFIDNRIQIINKELFTTEKDLENFKRQAGLTDVKSDAQLATKENSEYNKQQVENSTQLNIIRYLNTAISGHGKSFTVLPSQTGLQDKGLSEQIDSYNKLVIDRNRLARNSSDSNPAIANMDITIRATRDAIRATLRSIEKGLSITQTHLNRQTGKFDQRISQAPGQERQFVSISRQQEIKSQLYLMLLQKREENSIALASTANNAKIIDAAMADDNPVSPKSGAIYLVAFVLGLVLPLGGVYLADLLRYRIEGHADVEKLTKVPIVGDVPLTDESERKGSIAVRENENNLMAETFRAIRINLQFMLGDNKKVILITSTTSGEGKTFTATNLAISLSLLGKKVVLVGLDIRKPGLNKVFHISHKEMGFTQYLAHPDSTDLLGMLRPSEINDHLQILPGGTVPPNPTELLARPALEQAVDMLKANFDYVILDTAPIGLVSDTQLIGRVADLSVYVCRADYTPKADFTLIEDLRKQKKLPNLCTVINGVDMTQRKYGYYYGYGKKYGYGYGYGSENGGAKQKSKKK